MQDKVKVDGPVQVQSDSRHRVALDLAQLIHQHEVQKPDKPAEDRDYWLKLYAQCLEVSNDPRIRARSDGPKSG